jgi:hypothetical protein
VRSAFVLHCARTLSGAAVHRLTASVLAVTGVLALGPVARAAEVTRVVSALDDDNAFDFNATISWLRESKSGFIKRESQDAGGGLVKDLAFGQTREILNARLDFGILWDVGIHIGVPIVLSDNRHLDFDQSAGSGCTFPGDPNAPTPTCVNQQNSTVLSSGILPSDANGWGINSDKSHLGPFTSGARAFQGPTRSGLESLDLGINWAPFNQRRDDTRPTWQLGFEAKLDVFQDMRFDPSNPQGNTAVGPGYHQFIWSTAVSKRFRYFDPYFGAWYLLPVRTNGSIYQQAENQTAVNPQQRAGAYAGVEQIAWENPRADQRVTVEVRGRAEQHFYGRGASEMWEALAGSSKCAQPGTPDCRPGIDSNIGDTSASPYPGVTEIQQYASFGGDFGLNIQVGKYVRFRGLFGLAIEEPHYITYAGTGVDRNGDGRVDSSSGTEANANYRDALDAPGRRFKVEGTEIWSLFFEGSMMF